MGPPIFGGHMCGEATATVMQRMLWLVAHATAAALPPAANGR